MTTPATPASTAAPLAAAGASVPSSSWQGECRNCGALLHGAYCARCGQEDRPLDPTLRDLLADAWDAVTNLDGKVARSLRLLVTRPGMLTAEYLAGRRARYLTPFRLYLLCSFAFFFIGAIEPAGTGEARRDRETAAIDSVAAERAAARSTADRTASPVASLETRLERGNARLKARGGSLSAIVRDNVPNAMFVVMPLYAALVQLLYRSRRRRFPAHLVFALHMHAFFFAVLAVSGVSDVLRKANMLPGRMDSALGTLVLVTLLVYYPVAMRRVYGGRWGATVIRALVLGNAYSLLALVLLGGVIVGYLYLLGA